MLSALLPNPGPPRAAVSSVGALVLLFSLPYLFLVQVNFTDSLSSSKPKTAATTKKSNCWNSVRVYVNYVG